MTRQSDSVHFREEQRFTQWWVWLILIVSIAPVWFIWAVQVIMGKPVGNQPAPDIALWLLLPAIGLGLPLFMYSLKLTVEVRDEHLYVRFFPFVRREIAIARIRQFYARQYSPIREYGGWGLRFRWSRKRGFSKAYNVSGNRGVQLELIDGEKLLIGSRRADEFAQALAKRNPLSAVRDL